MKPLILILLAAVFAQGQSLAELARRERARQAQTTTTKVFTSEDLKSKNSGATSVTEEAKVVENPTPAAPGAPAAPGTPTAAAPPARPGAPATAPAVDPAQKWAEDTAKLRNEVRDLMAQETAIQLEINSASARMNAPITSQGAKDQAQKALDAAQQKLVVIRTDLARARLDLQEKDSQAPVLKK